MRTSEADRAPPPPVSGSSGRPQPLAATVDPAQPRPTAHLPPSSVRYLAPPHCHGSFLSSHYCGEVHNGISPRRWRTRLSAGSFGTLVHTCRARIVTGYGLWCGTTIGRSPSPHCCVNGSTAAPLHAAGGIGCVLNHVLRLFLFSCARSDTIGGSAIALIWRLRGVSSATQCGTFSESQRTTWNGRSGRWRHHYSVVVACPTAKTTRIQLTRPSPGAVLAVIKQFDKFRRGHAPSELGHDHCKHATLRKAAASARHPSLIEMQGLFRIAGILATQIDR